LAAAAAVPAGVVSGVVTGFLTADRVVNLISLLAVALPVAYFAVMLRSPRTTALERSRVRAYIPLFIGSVFFWLIQEQGASVLAQYADRSTDLDALGFAIPSAWFQSTGSFVLIVLTPFFAALWVRLGSRAPSAPVKFGVGLLLAGLSYWLLVLPASETGKSSPMWLFASFALITVGEIFLSPIGLSVTTKLAPAAFVTQMMGLWLASNAAAQGISAQVVRLYSRADAASYFGVVGSCGLLAGLILLGAAPFIRRRMGGADVRDADGGGAGSGLVERDDEHNGAQGTRT
jgi:POT family proton-dependent oligopeptide transporter